MLWLTIPVTIPDFFSGLYNSLATTTFPISGSQLMEVGGTTMGKSRDATVITIAVSYIQQHTVHLELSESDIMSNTGTILEKIVAVKRIDLARAKEEMPQTELEKRVSVQLSPHSLSNALQLEGVALIAEVKKASPSRGLLAPDFDPVALAHTYANNGAAAVSVLTETPHFQGKLEFLSAIKEALGVSCPPLLRKDFIFDEYQVWEARAWGADAILLITSILDEGRMGALIAEARSLGMEALVETHTESEVKAAVSAGVSLIGINNRNLATFEVDLETTHRLCSIIPGERVVVAESGIFTRDDVAKVARWGVDAVLVGEGLVKSEDVGAKVRELASANLVKSRRV